MRERNAERRWIDAVNRFTRTKGERKRNRKTSQKRTVVVRMSSKRERCRQSIKNKTKQKAIHCQPQIDPCTRPTLSTHVKILINNPNSPLALSGNLFSTTSLNNLKNPSFSEALHLKNLLTTSSSCGFFADRLCSCKTCSDCSSESEGMRPSAMAMRASH